MVVEFEATTYESVDASSVKENGVCDTVAELLHVDVAILKKVLLCVRVCVVCVLYVYVYVYLYLYLYLYLHLHLQVHVHVHVHVHAHVQLRARL